MSQQQLSFFTPIPDRVEMAKPENPVAVEIRRLTAAADRVLARLQQGPATNVELSVPEIGGLAAIRRVWDLTQHGHVIEKEFVKGGIWRYRLVKDGKQESA